MMLGVVMSIWSVKTIWSLISKDKSKRAVEKMAIKIAAVKTLQNFGGGAGVKFGGAGGINFGVIEGIILKSDTGKSSLLILEI